MGTGIYLAYYSLAWSRRQGPLYITIHSREISWIRFSYCAEFPVPWVIWTLKPWIPWEFTFAFSYGHCHAFYGKEREYFFIVSAIVESNTNVNLHSSVMIKVNKLSTDADQNLQHAIQRGFIWFYTNYSTSVWFQHLVGACSLNDVEPAGGGCSCHCQKWHAKHLFSVGLDF